jgi:hypothetical protein
MPPKRPKGLKQASREAQDVKRPRTEGEGPSTIMITGDTPDVTEAGECALILSSAKEHLTYESESGITLVRGTLHECTRLLAVYDASLNSSTNGEENGASLSEDDRLLTLNTYAEGLCLLALHHEKSDSVESNACLELAREQLNQAQACKSRDDPIASVGPTLKQALAFVEIVINMLQHEVPTMESVCAISPVDQRYFAWYAHRQSTETKEADEDKAGSDSADPTFYAQVSCLMWQQLCKKECDAEQVEERSSMEFAYAQDLITMASSDVSKQGELAELEEEVDMHNLEQAETQLNLGTL